MSCEVKNPHAAVLEPEHLGGSFAVDGGRGSVENCVAEVCVVSFCLPLVAARREEAMEVKNISS